MAAAAATAPSDPRRPRRTKTKTVKRRTREDAVVDVARHRRDRRLLPVPVLLADQHLAEDGQRPPVVSLFPPHPTLDNYRAIFKNPDFTKALRNSAVVALITTVLALSVGSFCAYALARLKLRGKFYPRDRPDDLDVPADRHRRAAVQALVGHRPVQHVDRPDHPVPDVRAAAEHLHPRLLLQGDPEGPRGGRAGRRRHPLPGVPQGGRPAGRTGPGHRRHPDVHRRLERVPARGDADVLVEGAHRAGGDRVLHRRDGARGARSAASRRHPWSSRSR